MKKLKNIYLIVFLLLITGIGMTIAYFNSSALLENIFTAGTYKTVTHEEFTPPDNWTTGDTTEKTITTKNEGTIPEGAFSLAACMNDGYVILNYVDGTESIVDSLVATKSNGCNVRKGVLKQN